MAVATVRRLLLELSYEMFPEPAGTLVGPLALWIHQPRPEWDWVTDREHGRQFRAVFVKIAPPNTLSGIERYLGSGMVKGIGPVYASRLVEAFGTGVFDVIEQSPARLQEIDGIGKKRANKITS